MKALHENGTKVKGDVVYSGKEITGKYLYVYGPDYDWTGKASSKQSGVHFIVDDYDINLPVDPNTIIEVV